MSEPCFVIIASVAEITYIRRRLLERRPMTECYENLRLEYPEASIRKSKGRWRIGKKSAYILTVMIEGEGRQRINILDAMQRALGDCVDGRPLALSEPIRHASEAVMPSDVSVKFDGTKWVVCNDSIRAWAQDIMEICDVTDIRISA